MKEQTTATRADGKALPRFDLRDEPWIPVVREDGTVDEVGLRTVLRDALRLVEVSDPLPTVEFGLYRLLTALVLDIFGPTSLDDLEDLLEAGALDGGRIDDYFDREWPDRFDLFHPDHPFLQTPGMDEEKSKPLAGLVPAMPSGTNVSHFHHSQEEAFGVCPAAAARLLTTIAPFMTAGGAGLSPSINGAPPWYVLLRGRSLLETVCLNTPVMLSLFPHAEGEEPAAWRSARPVDPERRASASLPESLTWRPRRILLIPDAPGRCALTGCDTPTLIHQMKFAAGFGAGFEWTDPNAAYRLSEKARTILRPAEGRAVWRDTAPLALLRKADYKSEKGEVRYDSPAIVRQFAELAKDQSEAAEQPLHLTLYGMRTDLKMKVFEWHRERLSLPAPLLWKGQLAAVAQEEIDRADSVAYRLRQAIKRAYPRGGAGNKAAFDTLIANAQNGLWQALRPAYDALLHELAPLDEGDHGGVGQARARWRTAVRAAAWDALGNAIDDLDTDADALERQAEARRSFGNALSVLLDPKAAEEARKARDVRSKKGGRAPSAS